MKTLFKPISGTVLGGMILLSMSLNVSAQHKGATPKSNEENLGFQRLHKK